MRRANRPGHPRGTRVGLFAVLILAALPLLAASALGAPAAQNPQHASYLPLTMVPPDYRIAFERDESIYVMNANGSDH